MVKKKQTPNENWVSKVQKQSMEPKSILKFYWKLFFICGFSMCALNFFLVVLLNNQYEEWKNIPLSIWIIALSIMFFDALNLRYLKTTPSYCALAEKIRTEKMEKEFQAMFNMSGILLLVNIVLIVFDHSKIIPTFCAIMLGWFFTGLLQAFRKETT